MKRKSSNNGTLSMSDFASIGKGFMENEEARESLKNRLIAMNDGQVPTDAKALATKIIIKAKASGVRRLPNRLMLSTIIESLFLDE